MKVLVIGESCWDEFQYGRCVRLNPEAPCIIFQPTYKTENEGMAGNVVSNLRAIDADLEIEYITNEVKPIKIRYVDEKSNQMLLRQDINDVITETPKNINLPAAFSAVIVSDYNKGYLSEAAMERIASMHPLTFLDTKKKLGAWSQGFTFIKINSQEYAATKDTCGNEDNLIVTLGEMGAMHKGSRYWEPEPSKILDLSGAGDSFLAGLVYEYLKTNDIELAIRYANKVAGTVITKRGVSTI